MQSACTVSGTGRGISVLVAVAVVEIVLWSSPSWAAPGDLDPSFGSGGKITTSGAGFRSADGIALQPDGKIVVVGQAVPPNTHHTDFAVARYNPNGSLDSGFDTDGYVVTSFAAGTNDSANAVAIQPDGKIVVAGTVEAGSWVQDFGLVRYNSDGSLDLTFGTSGKVVTDFGHAPDRGQALALQPDGKIVVAGVAGLTRIDSEDVGKFGLARYNPNGSLDTTFDSDGKVTTNLGLGPDYAHDVVLQPDGKIVAVGQDGTNASRPLDFALVRYNPDGSLDASFDSDGKVTTDFATGADIAYGVDLQPDGKIVAAGHTEVGPGAPADFGVARYNPDGSLDASFDTDGKSVTDFGSDRDRARANDVAIQSDGKIVAAGLQGRDLQFGVVRYNTNGSLDQSFGTAGRVTTDFGAGVDEARALVLQPDGKIVVAGFAGEGGFGVSRYLAATVPGPPTSVVATAGNGSATITWMPPGSNGGSSITSYTVTASPGPATTTVGGSTTTATLTGLTNGTSYTFTVVASNAVGSSSNSAPSNAVTPLAPSWGSDPVAVTDPPPAGGSGYRMVAGDGGIFTFGNRNFHGSTGGIALSKPIVGGATDLSDYDGYWMVASDGGVFAFSAEFFGSLGGRKLSAPAVEIEPTPTGRGYWIVLADGKVYNFGDAQHLGDFSGKPLNKPIIGMAVTGTGRGYWLVGEDGGIFSFGDAGFFGSTGAMRLNAPVVDLAPSVDNQGYYLVARDGGVFSFGSATFKGSTGDLRLAAPVIAMLVAPNGAGYWLAATDGGVFTFGGVDFFGSVGGTRLSSPVLDLIY